MAFAKFFVAKKNLRSLAFITVIALSGFINIAYADAVTDAINNLVGGYGRNQLTGTPTAMDQPAPDDPYYTLIGGVVNAFLNPTFSPQGQQQPSPQVALSEAALLMLLTTTNPSLISAQMLTVPIPLSPPQGNSPGVFGGTPPTQSSGVENVDANTLIDPIQYPTPQQGSQAPQNPAALNFISFAVNLVQPAAVINFAALSSDALKTALSNADVQRYVLARDTFAALKSVVLSNFYYLYNQRVAQSTDSLAGTFPAIKQTSLYPTASPLAVLHFIGTRTLIDPTWQQKLIQQTPPIQLLRLQVEQQAQTNFLLYQLYRLEERNLMTLTTIAAQAGLEQRTVMNQLYTKANDAITKQQQQQSQ